MASSCAQGLTGATEGRQRRVDHRTRDAERVRYSIGSIPGARLIVMETRGSPTQPAVAVEAASTPADDLPGLYRKILDQPGFRAHPLDCPAPFGEQRLVAPSCLDDVESVTPGVGEVLDVLPLVLDLFAERHQRLERVAGAVDRGTDGLRDSWVGLDGRHARKTSARVRISVGASSREAGRDRRSFDLRD